MPPKVAKDGTASTSKRKTKKDSDSKGEANESTSKKAKIAKEPLKPLDPALPTNTTFPIEVIFEAKKPGTTRLSTWNGKACLFRPELPLYVNLCFPSMWIERLHQKGKSVSEAA